MNFKKNFLKNKLLRDYQLQAIKEIDDFEEDCVVKMFCGTGKSLVMKTYVTDRLDKFPYSVFVFPSRSLISQFQDDYLKNIPNVLFISDQPGHTTDKVIIKKFIESHEQKIICVTYQSLHTWNEVSCDPDIMMFDEAHHVIESYVFELINNINCKKVFFTATPPDNDELGPIVYEYTHHDGVIEGKLNDFNIMIDFSTENTNESIYDSIIRSVMKTKNSRVLTYHQRVNTDDDTSVKKFVNQELLLKSFEKIEKEFPGHGYTSVKFLSIDAGTLPSERKKNLKLLDGANEHEIVILSSCKTIGEGVDTKNANMVVFVDAKNSLVEIIQNIGRIVRKQLTDSTILIPCWVDKTKYDGAEDKDAVIREDLSRDGNFNGILNVISALRQHDPELYELCLKYPKVFTKEEMKKNFERQGVKDTDKVWTQKQVDKITEESPEMQLEIHTHDVENPIEVIHPEAIEKKVLYKDEEGTYHEMKPKNKKNKIVPPRKKLFEIHSSDEIRVDWLITEESLGNAYIECNVVNKKTNTEKALEIVEWCETNDRKPTTRKVRDPIEKSYAMKLSNWKKALKPGYKGGSLPPSQEILNILTSSKYLKDYFNLDRDENMEKVLKIVEWCEINKRKPTTSSKDPIEKSYAKKLNHWKRSLKPGYKGLGLPPSQEILNILTKCEYLKDYFNLERDENMETALEIVEWCELNKRKQSNHSKDPIEKSYAQKLAGWKSGLKQLKHGYKRHDLPPSQEVQDILTSSKYLKDYFDLERDENMETALEIVEWCELNKRKQSNHSKDPIEKSYAQKLSGWKSALKLGYNKGRSLPPSQEILNILTKCEYLKDYFDLERDENMETALEIVEWCELNKRKQANHSKDPIEKSYAKKLCSWKSVLKLGYKKGHSLPPSQEILNILTKCEYLKDYFDLPVAPVPQCIHIWEVVDQDDEYHYKKCKLCSRRSKESCVAHVSGYTASNPEKKLEINTWLSQQTFIPGKAIVLDAKDMKTCNLLPFDPSNIIVVEYDTDTFEDNLKDPKFGKCLVNGDFLKVLKTVDPSEISFIYADFTGHFDKWIGPLLEYLLSIRLNSGVILGITWSENGSKQFINKHMKELGKFNGSTWLEIQESPSQHGYGYGANMYVEFYRKK